MNEVKESKSIQISLAGRSFSVVTDEDSGIIESAADRVNTLVQQMNVTSHGGEELRAIAFVALKLAIELQASEKQLLQYTDEARGLTNLLYDALI